MSNIEGLSKGVKLVSIEFNTAVKYVTRQGFVNDFPITFEYKYAEYLRTFVGFKQREGYTIVKVNGVDCIRFNKDLEEGVSVTIRRITPSGAVPHIYQYNSNAQGGAEFNAKTIDENFEYVSSIVEEIEEYNSITADSLSGLEDSFKDVKVVADEAKAVSGDALEIVESALEVAQGIDGKAQLALDTSKVAQEDAANALNIAQGVDGKAQTALDTSKDALLNSKEALQTAQGVDGKAQEALDKATSAELNAKVAMETSAQVDGKAQEALDNSVSALLDISKKRDISDTHFNSALWVQAPDSAGTGMFIKDKEGNIRGQVVSNSYGLQFTQVQEDGSSQIFTFPRFGEGGEIITDHTLLKSTPIGTIQAYIGENAPNEKWLLCRGQAFSAESYPDLAQLLPDLKIPDLRGVALRGLDANRGFDPDRELLSYQEDAIQRITGGIQRLIVHPASSTGDFRGAFEGDKSGGFSNITTGSTGTRSWIASFDSSLVARTNEQDETVMKNVAVNFIIKAR